MDDGTAAASSKRTDRRTLLAGLSALGGSLLAGCSAPSGDGNDDEGSYAYYFSLFNYTESDRTVSVLVEREDGSSILDRAFTLGGDSAREDITLPERPDRVEVRVGDGDPQGFTWPPVRSCRDENKAGMPGLEVLILQNLRGERDRIEYEWSCQAIRTTRE